VLVYTQADQEPRKQKIAQELGCTEIVTEDLNDGQIYRGMAVINPFK